MATTTNYSWTTPDDTALVKDGAAAIRSLGTAIDSTVFNNASAAIAKTIVDAKGDIIAATGADTVARLAVGANDTVLTADSSTATGLKWAAAAAGGGMTLLSTTTCSGSTTTISSINQTYKDLIIDVYGLTNNTANGTFNMTLGNSGGGFTWYWTGRRWNGTTETNFTNQSSTFALDVGINRSVDSNFRRFVIPQYAVDSKSKCWTVFGYQRDSSNNGYVYNGSAGTETTNTITEITLSNTGGTYSGGTVKIYGVN